MASALRASRVRMRGAEDPPSPLDCVLHDGLGFEQVVACVRSKQVTARSEVGMIQTRVVAVALVVVHEGID